MDFPRKRSFQSDNTLYVLKDFFDTQYIICGILLPSFSVENNSSKKHNQMQKMPK